MAEFEVLSGGRLAALNRQLTAAGAKPLDPPKR
jgi:hypothetical protein